MRGLNCPVLKGISLLFLLLLCSNNCCVSSAQKNNDSVTNSYQNYHDYGDPSNPNQDYVYEYEDTTSIDEKSNKSKCNLYVPTTVGPVGLVLNKEPSQAIKDMYNIKDNDNKGYIEVEVKSDGPTKCVKVKVDMVISNDYVGLDFNARARRLLFEKNERDKLKRSAFMIGVPSVGIIAEMPGTEFFAATPLSVYDEDIAVNKNAFTTQLVKNQFMLSRRKMSPIYSLWPSPTMFARAVALNVELKSSVMNGSLTTVSFLYYAQTEQGLEFADLLAEKIQDRITNSNIRKLNLYNTLRMLKHGDGGMLRKTRYVFENINGMSDQTRADIVVLSFGDLPLEQKQYLIENLLNNEDTYLDFLGIPWLIADMTVAYRKFANQSAFAFKKREGRRPSKSLVYFLIPNMDAKPTNPPVRMSHEGILEAGLKKALMLSKLKLSAMIHSEEWRPEDFFIACTESDSALCFSKHRKQEGLVDPLFLGFPKDLQIVTIPLEMIVSRNITRVCNNDAQRCDTSSIFFRNGTMNCTRGGQLKYNDYTLCGYQPLRKRKRIEEYAIAIHDSPFVIKNPDGSYDGLAVEIYDRVVAEMAKDQIVVNLKFVDGTSYGLKSASGTWTGVFGKLAEEMLKDEHDGYKPVRGQKMAVIGIGQVSVTTEREDDDRFMFTPPFAYTFYTYMVRKTSLYNAYLSFTAPFSADVWLTVLFVLFISGLYLFVMQIWNPFKESTPSGPTFTAHESFWHSFMVITQTGAPFGAHLYPSRVYSVFYWFFALVVCACYTGNLASFLTQSKLALTWTLHNPHYTYGVVVDTSVSKYANEPGVGEPWRYMLSKAVLVPNYTVGIQRMKNEKFVMLGTSMVFENFIQQEEDCMYYMWKGGMNHMMSAYTRMEPLAFVMRRRWRHATKFRQTMQKLQEDGEIQKIFHKWIKHKNGCGNQNADDEVSLAFENFLGLFILITVAIIVSYVILAIKLVHLRLRDGPPNEETEQAGVAEPLTEPDIELTEKV